MDLPFFFTKEAWKSRGIEKVLKSRHYFSLGYSSEEHWANLLSKGQLPLP